MLKDGIKQGIFVMEDAELTARMITIVLKGMEYPLIVENKSDNMESEINLMLNILFKGIEIR